MKKVLQEHALTLFAIVLVLGALAPVPYFAYYQIMNWVVVGAAAGIAFRAYRQHKNFVALVYLFLAVVFNPVAPIYFTAFVWQIADIAAAVLLTVSIWFLRKRN